MEWKSATEKNDGAISVPSRWLYLHYYEALNILFRMENALRVFVYVVLKRKFKEKWQETALQTQEGEQSTIAATAAKRIAQARGFGYLGYDVTSPLMYLNSGELTRIITSDTYWEVFKAFFRGRREIIKTKLDEVGTVRNALAHFRPIKHDDIELLKQNVKHTFIGIEQCLQEMIGTNRVVPTNTSEEWYKTLSTLGTTLCAVKLFQNASEKWIRLQVDYSCAVLELHGGDDYKSFQVSNLISPSIARRFPNLARHCIFITESMLYPYMDDPTDPQIRKRVSLVLAKDAIIPHYKEIDDQVKDVLLKVENETELLQKDNLARGELIDSVRLWANLRKTKNSEDQWWQVDVDKMKCGFGENDPPEYWAELEIDRSDFVAGTDRYPWMPSPISNDDDVPF